MLLPKIKFLCKVKISKFTVDSMLEIRILKDLMLKCTHKITIFTYACTIDPFPSFLGLSRLYNVSSSLHLVSVLHHLWILYVSHIIFGSCISLTFSLGLVCLSHNLCTLYLTTSLAFFVCLSHHL